MTKQEAQTIYKDMEPQPKHINRRLQEGFLGGVSISQNITVIPDAPYEIGTEISFDLGDMPRASIGADGQIEFTKVYRKIGIIQSIEPVEQDEIWKWKIEVENRSGK